MENNIEKNKEYYQDKINYLKCKKERLELELRFSTIEIKRLTDITKKNKSNFFSISTIVVLMSTIFIIASSIEISLIVLTGLGIVGFFKHKEQDKINKTIMNIIENNKKSVVEIEKITDDIEKYKLKIKELTNSNINEENVTINKLSDVTKKEEKNNVKIKKIGGNYGKNI